MEKFGSQRQIDYIHSTVSRERKQWFDTYSMLLLMTYQNSPQWGSEIGQKMQWLRDMSTLIRLVTNAKRRRQQDLPGHPRMYWPGTVGPGLGRLLAFSSRQLQWQCIWGYLNCFSLPSAPSLSLLGRNPLTKLNPPWTRFVLLPLVYLSS